MLEIGVQSKEVNFHIQGKWVLDFAGCWAYTWSKACGLLCLCSYFKRRARARCPLFFVFLFFSLCFLTWICISKMMWYAMQMHLTLSFGQCLNLPPTLSYMSLKESFLAPGKWKSSSSSSSFDFGMMLIYLVFNIVDIQLLQPFAKIDNKQSGCGPCHDWRRSWRATGFYCSARVTLFISCVWCPVYIKVIAMTL